MNDEKNIIMLLPFVHLQIHVIPVGFLVMMCAFGESSSLEAYDGIIKGHSEETC